MIGANLELLAEPGEQPDDLLAQARHALDQCGGLTRQLLALARRQPSSPRPMEVGDLLERTADMVRHLVGPDIDLLRVESSPTPLYVLADPSHLEQALVNLAVNARDALPRGGHIRFESAQVAADGAPAPKRLDGRQPATPPERWVRISVSDTGQGIPTELLPDIFEPYFTTKEAGRGTGLGLASVHALVHQNGGQITVHSQVAQGTRFDLWFPARDGAPPLVSPPPARPLALAPRTILVAEDMDAERAVVVRALAMAGYEVLEAANGVAALEILQTCNQPVHLLLTDVVMPRLGGAALAMAVRQRFPTTQVIFMTGWADQDNLGIQPAVVLRKPFRPAELLELVQQVLAAKP